MHTGLLWFDNSTTTLSVKIQKAMEYYFKKYGRIPDLCLVYPTLLEKEKSMEIEHILKSNDGLEHKAKLIVRPYRPVLPGHIWIGIEDKN